MDVFSRTFLPAAAETGVAIPTVSRHLPVFRRCVGPDDTTLLVTRCVRPTRPIHGEFLLLLTRRRLVVTQESRVVHRLRLHLNAELRHLTNVTWTTDPRMAGLELAVTAIDGIRERFWIKVGHPKQVPHLEALLSHAFRPRMRRFDPVAGGPGSGPVAGASVPGPVAGTSVRVATSVPL